MKWTKRMLSVVLALLMIVGLIPLSALPVFAADPEVSATVMELYDQYAVDIDEEYTSELFSFTASEAGTYVFTSFDREGGDPKATLYDNEMEELNTDDDGAGDGNFKITRTMSAGETVYLEAYMYEERTGCYWVKVIQLSAPTGMYFDEGDSYTVYVGDWLYLNPMFTPEDAYHENVDMTSDNETVLRWSEENEYFHAEAIGTATVTATSESGLTATCVVTVKEVPVLSMEDETFVTIPLERGRHYFEFTASTTGNYAFIITPQNGDIAELDYELSERDDDEFEGFHRPEPGVIQAKLNAGCTYRLCLNRYGDPYDTEYAATEFTIAVENIPDATGVNIVYEGDTPDTITGKIGSSFYLYHRMVPSHAMREGVTYTSSDEDIVQVEYDELYLIAEGTATITATSESGLTDTIEVTVQDYPTLSLGEPHRIEYSGDENYEVKFVPTVSGYYNFKTSNHTSGSTYAYLYNEDWDQIDSAYPYDDNETPQIKMQAYLNADETYYMTFSIANGNTVVCDVTVTKAPKATKMVIEEGAAISFYQGVRHDIYVTYSPADAAPEMLTWESSNTKAVDIWDSWDEGAMVWCKGTGQATVTASTQSGLQATTNITVKAAVPVSLNTVKIGTIREKRGSYVFTYTPSVSGEYILRTSSNASEHILVWETDGNQYTAYRNNGYATVPLTANETYYFDVSMEGLTTGEFTFLIQKAKTATSIALRNTTINLMPGEDTELPTVMATPTLAGVGDVEWTVADEDVAYVEGDWIYGNSAGTTTLTATTEDGLTATATVIVGGTAAQPCFVGKDITETAAGGNTRWYTFSPSASGYYMISSQGPNSVDPKMELYDSEFGQITESDDEVGSHFKTSAQLQADETYYVKIYIYSYRANMESFTWSINPVTAPTAIEIVQGDTYTGYVGAATHLEADFLPVGAGNEDYFFSSDDDTVEVSDYGYVEFLKPGTATVTVTSDSGLTDSIEITIIDPPTMAEGMSYPLGFSGNEMLMKFVPAETGVYSFYTDVSADLADPYVSDEYDNYLELQSYYNENSSLIQCKLTAGKTYYLRLYRYDDVPLGATTRVVKTTKKGVPAVYAKNTTKNPGSSERLRLTATDPTVDYGEVLGCVTSDDKLAGWHGDGYDESWRSIHYFREGVVMVTVQCTYGDAKATFTIKAATAMTLGKEYVAQVVDGVHTQYKFIPTKDGYYTFHLYGNNGQNGLGIEVMTPQGNYLSYDEAPVVYLLAGHTYYPEVTFRSGGPGMVSTTSYKIKVTSGTAPTVDYKGEFGMWDGNGLDIFVSTGETVEVRVDARGEGLTYQWYYANKGESTFTTSSITKNIYYTTMDSARDGRRVFCVITDKYGNMMTSSIVTIGIRKQLRITTQPTDVMARDGSEAKTSVVANGNDLTYTWYYKDANADSFVVADGFESASYAVTMNSDRAGRQVFCVVSDTYGRTVKTKTVTLAMGDFVTITTQPQNTEVKNGETAKITVGAVGDGLTYQWYFKSKGATTYSKSSNTTATYTTTMSSVSRDRYVYCVVKDKYGKSVKSDTVVLRMAATITKQPAATVYAKNNATAKVTFTADGDGLTYQWYMKNPDATEFKKSAYTTATYSATMSATNNGRQVYCIVTDKYGNTEQTNTVTMRMAASITKQPAATVYAKNGATAQVTLTAAGDGLTYQWYFKSKGATSYSKSSNTTETYTTTMSSTSRDRYVYCIVKDTYGNSVKSNTTVLRMAASITKQPATTVYAKHNATAKVTFTAAGDGLTYQWYLKNPGATTFSKSAIKTATYTTTMTATNSGRQVYCVVKDKYGKTVQTSTVTLRRQVTITTQPKTVTVKNGTTAKTTVKAVGAGLTYQWYFKNKGATSFTKSSNTTATYSTKMSATTNGRQVYCVVKDKYGKSVKSSTVTLKKK